MSILQKIIFVMLCTLVFFLIYRLYIYLRRQKAKKEKKIFCYYGFNFPLAFFISFLLLFPFIKISETVIAHSFTNFQIQLNENINDVDFGQLYEDIYEKSGADGPIFVSCPNTSAYLTIDVRKDGTILDFSIVLLVYKSEKGMIYVTKFLENNIVEFSHLEHVWGLDELGSYRGDLEKAFLNLNEINFGKVLTFSEGIDEYKDWWISSERIILNFTYRLEETMSEFKPFPSQFDDNIPSYYIEDEDSFRLIGLEETFVGAEQQLVLVLRKEAPDAFLIPSFALYYRIE